MSDDPHGSAFMGLVIAIVIFAVLACIAVVAFI